MEDPQPLPQPELPLCDSLIIWVSVVPCLPPGPPAGRAEQEPPAATYASSAAFPSKTLRAPPRTGGQEAPAASVPRLLSLWAHTATRGGVDTA